MQNNARIGGILSIVAGAWGLFWVLIMILVVSFWSLEPYHRYDPAPPAEFFTLMLVFYVIFGGFFVLVCALAIAGGIIAIRKRHWGLALAGAIAGALTFFPCGIPAVVFVSLGRAEFEAPDGALPSGQG